MLKLLSAAVISLAAYVCYLTYEVLCYPTIFISNETKECVRVITYSGEIVKGGCEKLPKKYFIVKIK